MFELAIGVLTLGLGLVLRYEPPIIPWILLAFGSLWLLLGASSRKLMITDNGDGLVIGFGPLPLFQRTVPYEDIRAVEMGHLTFLEGLIFHEYKLCGGTVWNMWGRDCVVIHLKKSVLRVGTDDNVNLARFLNVKISEQKE